MGIIQIFSAWSRAFGDSVGQQQQAKTHAEDAPPPPAVDPAGSEVPQAALEAEVGPAARFAVAQLPRPHARLKRIVGAERQVVAGTNYRMLVVLKDGKRWRLVVWKKLDGTMELTSSKRDR